MRRLCFFSLILFIALPSTASTVEVPEVKQALEAPEEVAPPPQPTPPPPLTSRTRREKASWYLLGNYSPLDLLIFPKFGGSIGLISGADRSWEFEYLRGSYSVPAWIEDLGSLTDERISLVRRTYFGGPSFNLSYGISYFATSLHIGDKYLNGLSGGVYPAVEAVDIRSIGFNIAIGNRWTFKHDLTLGVDWISWEQPIFVLKRDSKFLEYATNQSDRDAIEAGIKTICYFPRLAIAKIQLGMLF